MSNSDLRRASLPNNDGIAVRLAHAIEAEALEDWVPPAFNYNQIAESFVHLGDLISTIARVVAFPPAAEE